MIQALRDRLKGVQAKLNFETWSEREYPQFSSRKVRDTCVRERKGEARKSEELSTHPSLHLFSFPCAFFLCTGSGPRCAVGKCAWLSLGLSFHSVDATVSPLDWSNYMFRSRRSVFGIRSPTTALAVVRVLFSFVRLSYAGILCDCNL
jgi:hypothetical protein